MDLFTLRGNRVVWRFVWRSIKHFFPFDMWGDTFGRFGCMVLGHNRYVVIDESQDACRRCHKWIKKEVSDVD